ncbi:MAG: hypothetical protein JOZ83_09780 [Silvibacterium sp.]|nr:hypothetical protein [Silvibacterium sp.]
MKLVVRASVLFLAAAGIFAAITTNHSAKAQTLAASHLAVSSAMPTPVCEPGTPCKLHGR